MNKIYVGNLPYTTVEQNIEEMFESYGVIQDITLIRDRETGRSKGFCFVTFEDPASAESALQKNGEEMGGRALRINFAREKEDTRGQR